MNMTRRWFSSWLPLLAISFGPLLAAVQAENAGIVFDGGKGPGKGKHIVFVSGDEEYRSEEALPMLAKILATHHGFKCTVLFAIDPKTGTIDPNNVNNIPGLEALRTADMMVIFTRFRELPDDQMKYIDEFINSGKPILGLRTATHAFNYKTNKTSPYAKYTWNNTEWPGGFGQQVLGETWISHHGKHRFESTRGVINDKFKSHPILKGVKDIWGPTDVYGIKNLIPEAQVLVYGQVLEGMKPTDKPLAGPKNDPMMPLVWLKEYKGSQGKTSRIICTTMGAAIDLACEDLRRLLVNACYWGMGLEKKIPAKSNAETVGKYEPNFYGFMKPPYWPDKALKPADFAK